MRLKQQRFSQVAFSVTLVVAVPDGPIFWDDHQRLGRAVPFALQNGKDVQALDRKFQSLSASLS